MEALFALFWLTTMEIVLGIDNIVFIAILTSRLPVSQQASARRYGLVLAMGTRLLLLLAITWIMQLTSPLFELSALGLSGEWLTEEIDVVSARDLILLSGGLFLLWKSVREIHEKIEGSAHQQEGGGNGQAGYWSVIAQIGVLDIIFSLDSVITAVGMAEAVEVMMAAVILAVGVMLIFASRVSAFIEKNPTLKMLALSFLMLIGVMLIAEGIGTHIDKGYIYFAMAFALVVEMLNLRARSRPDGQEAAVETP